MILVIDNYDSFTFNLVQYIRQLGNEVTVIRNDQLTLPDIETIGPDSILISPGPGNPDSSGVCLDVVTTYYKEIPILGVCLGQQIIAQAFGGKIEKAKEPMHGKISKITHDQKLVFHKIPSPIQVARYHSLVVEEASLPSCLEVSARSEDGEIMALRHKQYQVEGVQFHPEAILTEYGMEMLQNFFDHSKGLKNNHDKDQTKRTSLII